MKFIKPSVELLQQENGTPGIYKAIEVAARTCYKSINKGNIDAQDFVAKLIKSKHFAMLEHGTVYLKFYETDQVVSKYCENPYSEVIYHDNNFYVTTNLRVLIEHNWTDDLKYIWIPSEHHARRYTIKFIIDRALAQEITRHRAFSFAMESQRFCNYSKSKFNNEITYIAPHNVDLDKGLPMYFEYPLSMAELAYFNLLKEGWSPQQARVVLPNATKTELIVTGFEKDWRHFLNLRLLGTTGKPHPDMVYVAQLVNDLIFKK